MFDAVIFDCDGVLVDSEPIAMSVWIEMAAEYGYSLSFEDALAAFRGGEMKKCVAHLEGLLGRAIKADFVTDFRARSAMRFETELIPVVGIHQVLDRLTVPFCVASNGPEEKMAVSLRVCGLLPYFRDRIVSAYQVGSFKPDPGLFLAAAQLLEVEPRRCAVVEDSILGVQAGIAAGMSVFAYCDPHESEHFSEQGVYPFSQMSAFLGLLSPVGKINRMGAE